MVSEKSKTYTDISTISGLLENAVKLLSTHKLGTAGVGGKYGEVWVANKLIQELGKRNRLEEYSVQIGEQRENHNADIYVKYSTNKNKSKRIEVKWSAHKQEWSKYNENRNKIGKYSCWGWNLGAKNNFYKRFDYCVLIQGKEDGTPKNCYIIESKEFEKLKNLKGAYPQSKTRPGYRICLLENYENYKRWLKDRETEGRKWKKCELEEELNKNRKRFKDKWNTIFRGLI